jgi:serine/threonine-protein kinase
VDTSLVGTMLDGRYEVLEAIGAGGVGAVYRARLVTLERTVAVKVLHEAMVQNAEFVARFEREARAMSRLHHPHCVAVIDSGVFQSRPFLVLEYLPGQTVTKLLEQGPFPPARAVSIALQVLEALEYFHRHHVIHRDLKAENLMLVESGGTTDFVKVLDFGMAKILEGPGADSQLSKAGLIPGTAGAMAPEQIQQLPPDLRIDIYATGILLYQMIVGQRPFRGPDAASIVKQQLGVRPTPPRQILGEAALSAELESVILKALEKNRDHRFATADDMAEALLLAPEGRLSGSAPALGTWESSSTIIEEERSSSSGLPEARAVTSPPGAPPPLGARATPSVADSLAPGVAASSPARLPPPLPAGRRGRARRAAVGVVISLGGVVAALAYSTRSPREAPPTAAKGSPREAPPSAATPVAAVAPRAEPAIAPPPAPVAVPWLAHRDLALTYSGRGQHNDAFREVKAAVGDDAAAAGADPSLVEAAVAALAADRVSFVVGAFRSNPRLVEALTEATAKGARTDQRHAAYDGLRSLGQQSRADLVAMRILDVEQASTCAPMRAAFKKLRGSKDPRLRELVEDLLARGRKDPHAKCLGRALRRSR